MEFKIQQKVTDTDQLYIIDDVKKIANIPGLADQTAFLNRAFGEDHTLITINHYTRYSFIYLLKAKKTEWQTSDTLRKAGAELQAICNKNKLATVTLTNFTATPAAALLVAEGLALANYQFLKYRTEAKKQTNTLNNIYFTRESATLKEVNQLAITIDAIYRARTLVNEPLSYLSAEQLSREISQLGKEAGFKVTVFNKARIEKEKMGGLLSVNRGSIDPPTFTIMEHVPKKAINKKPIVLVGKGVVYDTGGLSLKPTANSMDRMKSDMSGAALVSCAMYAIAKMQLPLHIIALVPATDNRPGENAYVPGDVITMLSGATVEVLNTDAEGRMILGDALQWAKRYKPELVMDFATLTGAASAAVGEHGIVCMGNAPEETKMALRNSGFRQYERLVEYPMWDEYGEQIKSDIADIKNVGGATGGAITAGKFLEHFTDYPWMHFDIAGVSFATARKGYTPTGGTAYGMRMLLDFLAHYGKA
jgi:leucyl aminopeptidase